MVCPCSSWYFTCLAKQETLPEPFPKINTSATRVAASGRNWPLPASGRKWPQVAASGRFLRFQFPHSKQPPCKVLFDWYFWGLVLIVLALKNQAKLRHKCHYDFTRSFPTQEHPAPLWIGAYLCQTQCPRVNTTKINLDISGLLFRSVLRETWCRYASCNCNLVIVYVHSHDAFSHGFSPGGLHQGKILGLEPLGWSTFLGPTSTKVGQN